MGKGGAAVKEIRADKGGKQKEKNTVNQPHAQGASKNSEALPSSYCFYGVIK